MNVFETIYLNADNPIKRDFLLSETALDIAIAKADKEYTLESGLIELGEDKLFIESENTSDDSSNNAKKENSFIKVIKSICAAIKNFIGDVISSIVSLFDGRDNIDFKDYLESPTGKIRLETDARQLEKIVNDEIRKGNKFLQAIASVTGHVGVTDEMIDNWIRSATTKLDKLTPVIVPAALGFGFKRIFSSMMNTNKKEIDDAEKAATSGDISDPEKQSKIKKILGFMNTLIKETGKACSDWAVSMDKAKKKAKIK